MVFFAAFVHVDFGLDLADTATSEYGAQAIVDIGFLILKLLACLDALQTNVGGITTLALDLFNRNAVKLCLVFGGDTTEAAAQHAASKRSTQYVYQ